MGLERPPNWLAVDGLLAQFVAQGVNTPSPWNKLKGQLFLGDAEFVQRMQAHGESGRDDVQIPLAQCRPPPPSLVDVQVWH